MTAAFTARGCTAGCAFGEYIASCCRDLAASNLAVTLERLAQYTQIPRHVLAICLVAVEEAMTPEQMGRVIERTAGILPPEPKP